MHAALMIALALSASPAPPVVPVQATTAFDGTWSGTGTLTARRGSGTACGPETVDRRFTIQNGQINFPYDTRYGVTFSGPIGADGSFDIAGGQSRFQGQANGAAMTATFTGTQCVRSFQFRRRRN
jgi:hypothetical protein